VAAGSGCTLNWGGGNQNADPLFINETAGDFHLSQIAAGQLVNSPCVDAGGNLGVFLGFTLYSTATTGMSDLGIVDLGYHYPTIEPCRRADLIADEIVNFRDLAIFALAWLNEGCSDDNEWCGGADLGFNGSVGVDDLKVVADCWMKSLVRDTVAPTPDPMTWAVQPHTVSTTSVGMVATPAIDDSGVVYYQFAETNGVSSGWQTDPCYVATGLDPNAQHCYKVRARDKYNNTTGWSEEVCISHIGDVNAPSPAPTIVFSASVKTVSPDVNTYSGQFLWSPDYDWWHKVVVDVTGITDDSGGSVEIRFICNDDSSLSSNAKIPAASRPILVGQPVTLGSKAQGWRLTYDGSTIVYDVKTDKWGGMGIAHTWTVCAYDVALNAVCSTPHEIGP
jgi:hypothetical protein